MSEDRTSSPEHISRLAQLFAGFFGRPERNARALEIILNFVDEMITSGDVYLREVVEHLRHEAERRARQTNGKLGGRPKGASGKGGKSRNQYGLGEPELLSIRMRILLGKRLEQLDNGRVRQRGVISAVALGHRHAAFAVMCRG